MSTSLTTDLIKYAERETVGRRKVMETTATLFRNGLLVMETLSECNHWCEGLRGRVFAICIDTQGRAIWVTKEYKCTTRGSIFDPTCPSQGKDVFQENIPEIIAQQTNALDIVQDDGPLTNWREQLKRQIKDTREVLDEVRKVQSSLE